MGRGCDPGRKDGFERLFACFAETPTDGTMGEENMVGGVVTNAIQSDLINPGGGETRLDGELGHFRALDLHRWTCSSGSDALFEVDLNETKMCFGSQGRGR